MTTKNVTDTNSADNKCLLIIFVKNLVSGHVKTRLAKTIGHDKAIEVYTDLLRHTHSITNNLPCCKAVHYSAYVEADDLWTNGYQKQQQHGNDLGERMHYAIAAAFTQGCRKVVLIGSDCFEITTGIIEDAFTALNQSDIVIGPATDGGYYLIGMSHLHPALFAGKSWSTGTVYSQTINDATAQNLSYSCLPILSDIDEEKDLITLKQYS